VFRSGESRNVLRFGRRAGERDFKVGSRWCNRWGTSDKDSSKADSPQTSPAAKTTWLVS
jgi:hypothetical protein